MICSRTLREYDAADVSKKQTKCLDRPWENIIGNLFPDLAFDDGSLASKKVSLS